MSRETLDGDRAAEQRLTAAATSTSDRPPSAIPALETSRPARRSLQTVGVLILVAVLSGSLGTVLERRSRVAADEGVRVLGVFVTEGAYEGSSRSGRGTAGIQGNLHVVNAGAHPVEVVGAVVAGVPVDRIDRPRRVEPGEAVRVNAALELPCSQVPSEKMSVDVRVVADDGGPRPSRRETLVPLDLAGHVPLDQQVLSVCSGRNALARAERIGVDADGRVVVDLESTSTLTTQVRVLLAPRMGARVNGASTAAAVVPAQGAAQLVLEIEITDCTRARQSLGASYEVLSVEVASTDDDVMGYLEGWQPSVATAAFGFALARQCG